MLISVKIYGVMLCKMLRTLLLMSSIVVITHSIEIDTQLGNNFEDCFERQSIGEQLPNDAIYRIISKLRAADCENLCLKDRRCQSYDFGVGVHGNTSCGLSRKNYNQVQFVKNPDFDVYVRRINCEQAPPRPIQINPPNIGPNLPSRPNKPSTSWLDYNGPKNSSNAHWPNIHKPNINNYNNDLGPNSAWPNDHKPSETWIRQNHSYIWPKLTNSYDIWITQDISNKKPHLGFGYYDKYNSYHNFKPDATLEYHFGNKKPEYPSLTQSNNFYDTNNNDNRKVYDVDYENNKPSRPYYDSHGQKKPIVSNFIYHFDDYKYQIKPHYNYNNYDYDNSNYYHKATEKPFHDGYDQISSQGNLRPDPESHYDRPNFSVHNHTITHHYDDNYEYYDTLNYYAKPNYDSWSVYDQIPNYHQKPSYSNKPSYQDTPNYSNKPIYQETPNYSDKPSYQETPNYSNKPIYQETPIYTNKPIYQETPNYSNKPIYQETPNYSHKPSYQATPNYGVKPIHSPKPAYGASDGYGMQAKPGHLVSYAVQTNPPRSKAGW